MSDATYNRRPSIPADVIAELNGMSPEQLRAQLEFQAPPVTHYVAGCEGSGNGSPFCSQCDSDNYNKWFRETHGSHTETREDQMHKFDRKNRF
jgi:hypothetical protein